MRYCIKPRLFKFTWACFLALLLILPVAAKAEGIEIRSAELEPVEETLVLNAELEISLSPAIEDVLNKGVPLNFIVDFELKKPRWYWLDETIAAVQQHIRLNYHALTRQYQLSLNGQYQNFSSLSEARRELGRLHGWTVVEKGRVKKHTAYVAGLRMKLDMTQLPKPLQVNALASKEWNLDSEWHRWNIAP
ncbi:MAG: DUF4390 domain-containing protein [Sulfuricella sp.]|nr:DUF4390 domain-containing protein [Gammaproteobacteria bacterium]